VAKVELFTTDYCGYCVRAKMLLENRGVPFEEIHGERDPGVRERMEELTGGWTYPQIVIDGKPIGGYTELVELDRSGALAALAS
jgi:glutaredoxin 3